MKLNTNIKAGEISMQHNEKLANDTNIVEQKKSVVKKLRLSKETIRELKEMDLQKVAGGANWHTAGSRQAVCCG